MTPAAIVQTLRSRGYRLERRGDRLHLAGPRPENEAAALDWLRRHKSEVLALLDAEKIPVVRLAMRELGATLVELRAAGAPKLPPIVDCILALDFTRRKRGLA